MSAKRSLLPSVVLIAAFLAAASSDRFVETMLEIPDIMKGKEFLLNEEFKNQLQSEISAEGLLSPANQISSSLANLASISRNMAEIRIGAYAPEGGFKHIKYPDSFRATTVQLDNAGSRIVLNATATVDMITMLAYRILDYVKQAGNILNSGDEQTVEIFLPHLLKRIQESAEIVVFQGQNVVTQLDDFFNFAKEVQEATKTITFRQPDDWPLFQDGLATLLDQTVKMRDAWSKLANFLQTI